MEKDCSCRPDRRGRYLIQRVIGQGRLEKRCLRVKLCPSCGCLPCGERAALTGVTVSGEPFYEELPCHERGALLLRVTVPLSLTVCVDGCDRAVPCEMTQTLRVRLSCPQEECWRHRVLLRAAARLRRRACLCDGYFDACVDLCIDGYIVADCVISAPDRDLCPPRLPLYPPPCRRDCGCGDRCDCC